MSPSAKRKAKQLLIEQIKAALAVNGYSETKHGKWINTDGNKRFCLDGNNCKIQRKIAPVVTQYSTTPSRWINSASVPFAYITVASEAPLKLKVDRTKTYGQ